MKKHTTHVLEKTGCESREELTDLVAKRTDGLAGLVSHGEEQN